MAGSHGGPVARQQHQLLLGRLSVLALPGREGSSDDTDLEHFPSKNPLVLQPHLPACTPKLATPCFKLCLSGELLLVLQNPRRSVPSSEMSHGVALRPKQEHACVNPWAWLRGEGRVLTAVLVIH